MAWPYIFLSVRKCRCVVYFETDSSHFNFELDVSICLFVC